jgi:hypothetical protein
MVLSLLFASLLKLINKKVFIHAELINQQKYNKTTKFDKKCENIFNFSIFTKDQKLYTLNKVI